MGALIKHAGRGADAERLPVATPPPAQALAGHAGRLSPLSLDRGRCLHVSEPFILRSSANCLFMSFVHFSAGLVFSTTVVAIQEREKQPRVGQHPSSWPSGLVSGATPLKPLFQATTDLQVGLTPRQTVLSSPGPRSQRQSTQPPRRASSEPPSYWNILSAPLLRRPLLSRLRWRSVSCFLPLPHAAAAEAPRASDAAAACLSHTPPPSRPHWLGCQFAFVLFMLLPRQLKTKPGKNFCF